MEEQATAYCVKERAKRPMKDVREVVFSNGKHALQGTCSSCGAKLTRFLPDKPDSAGKPRKSSTSR
ncbi:MAG: DUF5679 domain-containing protein [Rudaea sp.]